MKRRLVGLFLVAFALWPLLHFAATTRYGVDPWKLFGWAMYCVPGPLKTLRVVAILEENELRRLDYRAYAATDQRLVDTYRQRWGALGDLASRDALVAGLLAQHPEFEGVVIARHALWLDAASGTVSGSFDYTTHWRDERDASIPIPEPTLQQLFAP